ncbi:sphinganine C(4)-monooxygenase 1-like protein [Carex littledalei]|uniref:aldehyde oxygenase (deformylating) n=1 Tax=Carex littledalei TaxID=544730 RepID=A0A833VZ23_9POAL|nr:sphinganine C(4)-monooxygenase 1-like protein [Carex littledalei]
MVFWEGHVSDELVGTIAPIALYWLYGGAYMLMPPLKQYRLHTKREEDEKNIVDIPTVVKGVLFQQLLQAVTVQLLFLVTSGSKQSEPIRQPPFFLQLLQILIAMFVMDTWQYFVHRYLHTNTYLYRHIHSYHHCLVVPCAIGALYNHPLEGLLVDTLGGAISFLVSGMTARTSVYFFCLSVMKTVDDHCGLWLPGKNIFHIFFENNCAYHDIHHSLRGLKYNYAQPFFSFWDKIMGTYVPYKLMREDGGLMDWNRCR